VSRDYRATEAAGITGIHPGRPTAMPSESIGIARPGRVRTPRRARPVVEALEGRALMTGNLWITNAELVDAAGQPIAAPVIGEEVIVEAQWMSSGLSTSDQYTVQFTMDGVSLDSSTVDGEAGDNIPFTWYLGGWFAKGARKRSR
jgi:hypothetical protein